MVLTPREVTDLRIRHEQLCTQRAKLLEEKQIAEEALKAVQKRERDAQTHVQVMQTTLKNAGWMKLPDVSESLTHAQRRLGGTA